METEAFWAGSFGDEYNERNKIEPAQREDFWRSAIEYCQPESALEVGCNRGHNLLAIQSVDSTIDLLGVDINASAVNEAKEQGINARVGRALEIVSLFGNDSSDLVFTCGVLIHIPPADLQRVMRQIIDVSKKYILAVEYYDQYETEVEYRGHAGKLWKRPFGKLYEELGCTLVSYGPASGFDKCSYFLMTKPGFTDIEDTEELF